MTSIDRDQLRWLVEKVTAGKSETGAGEVIRQVEWLTQKNFNRTLAFAVDRRNVGRALRELEWRRDGFTGIGYDREPRYVRGRPFAQSTTLGEIA